MVCSFSLLDARKARFIGEPLSARSTRSRQKKFPEFRKKSLEALCSRMTTLFVRWSVEFVNSHVGVDGEIGIANRRAGRCGQMAGGSGKFTAGTFNGVGISIALGAGHGKRIGGNEFLERSAMAVRGDVAAFCLGNLQEVASNARQADRLRRSRTYIRGWHPLQRKMINDEEKGGTDQKAD